MTTLCIILFIICCYLFLQKEQVIIEKEPDLSQYRPIHDSVSKDLHNEVVKMYADKLDVLGKDLTTKVAQLEQKDDAFAKLLSQKKSSEVRTGHTVEKLAPVLDNFPYDSKNLVPIFQPLDYIMFGEDEIVFIEYKSGQSKLSQKQKKLQKLINDGKIRFEIHRVSEDGYEIQKG